ncbi:MAG TPA: hypothetical protein VE665_00965, partial [Hyphomicrobiaceae bacterium]|nr:hypothetical protein [Hyphomicrobiaceae bacterium]
AVVLPLNYARARQRPKPQDSLNGWRGKAASILPLPNAALLLAISASIEYTRGGTATQVSALSGDRCTGKQ